MEEEVREILREATLRASIEDDVQLGSRIAARFRDHGLDHETEELRGQRPKPDDFEQ